LCQKLIDIKSIVRYPSVAEA